MPPTQLAERQINLRAIFSPEQILRSNGYEVAPTNAPPVLLINEGEPHELEALYACFDMEKSRNELRKYIYYEISAVSQPENAKLVAFGSFQRDRKKFDNSLEWFIGEMMVRKFAAFSAGRGVTVKNIIRGSTKTPSGDYDALCVLRNLRLAYFECKSGTFDETDVLKCYERMQSLNCEFSILIGHKPFEDDKLKWTSEKLRLPLLWNHTMDRINISGNSTDLIYDFNNCYLIDMSGNFINKIRTVLRVNDAKRNGVHSVISISQQDFEARGYERVVFHGPVSYS